MNTFWIPELDSHLSYHDLPGSEPALVFLHGWGSASSAAFPNVASDPVLNSRRSILVDHLGFGFSDSPPDFRHTLEGHAEKIGQLLDSLGLSGCTVVGHSWGGSIAIVLATRRPDLVGHLIVAEPNLGMSDATMINDVASQSEDEWVDRGHAAILGEIDGLVAATPTQRSYRQTMRVADPVALHRAATHLAVAELIEPLLSLPMPTAYLMGELSKPHSHYEIMAAHSIPVLEIGGTGHAMMAGNPAGVAQAIATFLAS